MFELAPHLSCPQEWMLNILQAGPVLCDEQRVPWRSPEGVLYTLLSPWSCWWSSMMNLHFCMIIQDHLSLLHDPPWLPFTSTGSSMTLFHCCFMIVAASWWRVPYFPAIDVSLAFRRWFRASQPPRNDLKLAMSLAICRDNGDKLEHCNTEGRMSPGSPCCLWSTCLS